MKLLMMLMMLIMLISLFFVIHGIYMHFQVGGKEDVLHGLQEEYFSLSKATRDSAETDSFLNDQLVEIQKAPSNLLRLKLVGVGKMLSGIYVLLFGILIALIVMPVRLGKLINEKK